MPTRHSANRSATFSCAESRSSNAAAAEPSACSTLTGKTIIGVRDAGAGTHGLKRLRPNCLFVAGPFKHFRRETQSMALLKNLSLYRLRKALPRWLAGVHHGSPLQKGLPPQLVSSGNFLQRGSFFAKRSSAMKSATHGFSILVFSSCVRDSTKPAIRDRSSSIDGMSISSAT